MSTTKIPPKLPTFVVKAMWDGTSVNLLVPAKDEVDAKRRAWMRIAHTEGGSLCLRVDVLRRVE